MALIGINGYSNSGKDELARSIQKIDPSYENKKFAGKLKQVASILLGEPIKSFEDREYKESTLDYCWWTIGEHGEHPMTVREFLQILGTECLRNGLHNNVWVNALFADYKPAKLSEYNPSKWVISDLRFPNEARAIKDRGGYIIRIDRPGVKPVNNHPSETALDNWDFDFRIANVSDLVSLEYSADFILKQIQ
jgi:hypothetical protein